MARPRLYHQDRITTAIRLPRDLHTRLREEAVRRDVSVNLLVERALAQYLDRLTPVEDLDLDRAVG